MRRLKSCKLRRFTADASAALPSFYSTGLWPLFAWSAFPLGRPGDAPARRCGRGAAVPRRHPRRPRRRPDPTSAVRPVPPHRITARGLRRSFVWICSSFHPGNASIDRERDLHVLHPAAAEPPSAEDVWLPYNEQTEQTIWRTSSGCGRPSFLDDLSIEVDGLHLPERRGGQARHLPHGGAERVKIVDYDGIASKVDRTKIDEKLRSAQHRAASRLVPRRRNDSSRGRRAP